MKPYQKIPIHECDDPLVPLPLNTFSVVSPHPYEVLGAPYGDRSPYWLRREVLEALKRAQATLQLTQPNWRIQIFDAYRPIAVQQFMVDYTTQTLAHQRGQSLESLPHAERQSLLAEVYQFWAPPSHDPKTPPPHSTGAAIDITLVDATGTSVAMGSPIDEISERSHPYYFQHHADAAGQQAHHHRCLLSTALKTAGFQQHPHEWWHFSLGDQLWAWCLTQTIGQPQIARYGRVELPLENR